MKYYRLVKQLIEIPKDYVFTKEDWIDLYKTLEKFKLRVLRRREGDERDGCVAGCPECIWGGKFPAKDCCEGYEPLTSQRSEVRNQRSDK